MTYEHFKNINATPRALITKCLLTIATRDMTYNTSALHVAKP